MKTKKEKANIVCTDFLPAKNWMFLNALSATTQLEWQQKGWKNSGLIKGKWANAQRLLGYFAHAWSIFFHRKRYDKIVAWQQFYGLIFAFYCKLFHCKKVNQLIVMTFIYKDKGGFVGKLYKRFIKGIVRSKYVDKFVVFAESEVGYYSDLFGVDKKKFEYMPLGIDEKVCSGEPSVDLPDKFILSVGRSNRDYAFLVECADKLPLPVVILADTYKCDKLPDNVILYNNIHNIEYLQILNKCYAVVIPLKDPNISSGQLVMLRAMQYKKPIIITNSKAVDSYVKDGYNALVIDKNDEAFVNATNVLMQDKDFYDQLVDNGYTEYKKKYSLSALGKNIGNLFAENSVVSIR